MFSLCYEFIIEYIKRELIEKRNKIIRNVYYRN